MSRAEAIRGVEEADAKKLNYGRKFMMRLVHWLYQLEWPREPWAEEERYDDGDVSFQFLVAAYVAQTGTEMPVPYTHAGASISKGHSTWVLVDIEPKAAVVNRTLKENASVLHYAIAILEKMRLVYPLARRGYSWDTVTIGNKGEAFGFMMRPKLMTTSKVVSAIRQHFYLAGPAGAGAIWRRRNHGTAAVDVLSLGIDISINAEQQRETADEIWCAHEAARFPGIKVDLMNHKGQIDYSNLDEHLAGQLCKAKAELAKSITTKRVDSLAHARQQTATANNRDSAVEFNDKSTQRPKNVTRVAAL